MIITLKFHFVANFWALPNNWKNKHSPIFWQPLHDSALLLRQSAVEGIIFF